MFLLNFVQRVRHTIQNNLLIMGPVWCGARLITRFKSVGA